MKRGLKLVAAIFLASLTVYLTTCGGGGGGGGGSNGGSGGGGGGGGGGTTPFVAYAIAGGSAHTIAFSDYTSKREVWAWGSNAYGQLGDGTTTLRKTPIQVSGLTNVGAIAGGGDYGAISGHSIAVKNDGTVWAWGENGSGQLGDGTTTDRYTPVQVSGLTNVLPVPTFIAGGGDHSIALKDDGTVWAWGSNAYGQLGDGTWNDRNTPVQVSGLTGVSAVAAGRLHSIAIDFYRTVWTWGDGLSGQLGNGYPLQNRNTPVQVSGLTNVIAIAGGVFHSIALKSDGTVWAWGDNGSGQLGDGTTISRATPVQVSGLTNVGAIAAGAFHSIAI
ncbi:MAG: hypothetical protein AAB929_02785, partial [Patescibacteria group bacterium]